MRGTAIAPVLVLRELGRLLDVYSRPKHWPPSDDEVARLWAELLGDVSSEQLAQAVTTYLRDDHQFMPRPGTLRVLALKQRGGGMVDTETLEARYWAWEQHGYADAVAGSGFSPCPVCHAVVEPGTHGRVEVRHDHDRHFAAGVSYVGPRTGPVRYPPGGIPYMVPSGGTTSTTVAHAEREPGEEPVTP